ncbi:hypothetical protein ACFSUP_04260 [Gracilibacillus thailandensis]|uniref:hypothetical protein n=1 Tax=Gracilibacillus thailandensis TaxID=563735 RepID=UPI00362A6618
MSSSASVFRTVYLLVGIAAAVIISSARAGQLVEGVIAATIVAPTAVGLMWALRDRWWITNWWDLGGGGS